MSQKKKKRFYGNAYWDSEEWNRRKALAYLEQMETLAMNRFNWEGLPPSVDTRYLEWCLLHEGLATIAQPPNYPGIWVCGKAVASGEINRYYNPTKWQCIGANGDAFNVNPYTGVLIWDNMARNNPWLSLDMWARELADIDRTRDVNRAHIKNPIVFSGPRTKKHDLDELVKSWLGGEPAIMVYEGLEAQGIAIDNLKIEVPFYGAELFADAMNVLNRVYTFLGIENLPTKSERMIQEEIQSTMEPTSIQALNCLNSRKSGVNGLASLGLPGVSVSWHYGKYGETPAYVSEVENEQN